MTPENDPAAARGRARLDGHVAVVTGAAAGIGAAFAVRLAAEGAAVAVVDRVEGAATVAQIEAAGGRGAPFVAELTSVEQIAALPARVGERLGPADILVNNAGIYPQAMVEDLDLATWRQVFAVNVEAMLLTIQAFLPGMRDKGWGRIVNMASNSIDLQLPGVAAYVASKMAVIGLTRAVATEAAAFGVTANTIAPSVVRTPGTAGMDEEGFEMLAQMQTVKRTMVPEDLTGALAFLVSDDAAFVTAQNVYVDGGLVRS
jgi:NAD(P)-dependent dehydrogenase (short-subunit alcohol dehydrogenase family)